MNIKTNVLCRVCGECVATITVEMVEKSEALIPIRRQVLLDEVKAQIAEFRENGFVDEANGAQVTLEILEPMFKKITLYCEKCNQPFDTIEITKKCPTCEAKNEC